MPLVRTPYGLIYNTDGSLCVTLLPGGGVAVTEGTTNIAHGEIIYDTTPPVPVPGYPNALAKYTTDTSDLDMTLDPEVQAHSVQAWVYMAEDWDYTAWEFRFLRNGSTVEQIPADPTKKGQWQHVKGTFTGSADQVQLRSRGSGTHRGRWTAMVQIEEKPFATPFVEGTRPAGALSYNLPISINGDWTIAKWVELEPYYMDKTLSGTNAIDKFRLPLVELGQTYNTVGHGVLGVYGAWGDYDTPKTIRIMANKDQNVLYSPTTVTLAEEEYNNKILAVLSKSGPMLTAYIYTIENKYVLTRDISSFGDISQIAPQLNFHTVTARQRMYCKRHLNTLVCPYAVNEETSATWHSLDAPFFDPREITTAELAAREYAEAQAELARVTAEAYADGRVTEEEQARIADAQQKLQEAKQYADQKAAEDIDTSKRKVYTTGVTIGEKGLVVDKNQIDQVAVGDISGRQWRGSPLPSGTFGLWAPDGFIAVSDLASTEIIDYSGITYIGNGMYYDTVPGFEVSITVPIGTKLLIYLSAEFYYEFLPSYSGEKYVDFRLLLNDQTIIGTPRQFSDFAPEGMYQGWQTHRNLSITTIQEATNEFNKVNLQWRTNERVKVTLSNRILGILAIRR